MTLVNVIKEQTKTLFWNVQNAIDTVPDDKMNTILYDAPIWWYFYHTLHSLDRWFIDPNVYEETVSDKEAWSREQFTEYFNQIKEKINLYLDNLTDGILEEKPDNCEYTRMALVLGQYRHAYYHIGTISGAMIYEIGKFPKCVGLDSKFPKENESKYYD